LIEQYTLGAGEPFTRVHLKEIGTVLWSTAVLGSNSGSQKKYPLIPLRGYTLVQRLMSNKVSTKCE
jgi:hypothetical protein